MKQHQQTVLVAAQTKLANTFPPLAGHRLGHIVSQHGTGRRKTLAIGEFVKQHEIAIRLAQANRK